MLGAARPTTADHHDALTRLGLQPAGPVGYSATAVLQPVTRDGQPAFLKVTNEPEELIGVRALQKWDGNGAVRVLAQEGNAVLLELGGPTLRSLVSDDAAATRTLCAVAARLHQQRLDDTRDQGRFPTLRRWFSSLFADTTPRFDRVRPIAGELLERDVPPVVLHGDLHHENVLHGAQRGWLAIDPKGLLGPREFDYCNIFTNWTADAALAHFDSRLQTVASTAGIELGVLLRWVASWSALSGIWHRDDDDHAAAALSHSITELALERLGPQR